MQKDFAEALIRWQKQFGRHQLPWQTEDPYVRWLSEVMLQQTQVVTVTTYFERFIKRFPTVSDLAQASEDEVMALWAGLGYYSRARNLHKAAKLLVSQYGGTFPKTRQEWEALPGIGRSTAAAIVAFSFGQKETILDGNVKRVLARYFAIEHPLDGARATKDLWALAEELLPDHDIGAYIQGLMDLGATVCTRNPSCTICPFCQSCKANQLGVQNTLPLPKPKKVRPEKEATFFLLWKEDRFFVQKRMDKGVWQGLYCLPQLDGLVDEQSAEQLWRQKGVDVQNARALSPIVHDFSHYRLHLYPIALKLKNDVSELHGLWVKASDMQRVALPMPIEVLVKTFFFG